MARLLATISSLKEELKCIDGYVIGYEKFTFFGASIFSYKEIEQYHHKEKLYVLLNCLIHENELEIAKKEVSKLASLGVNFIIQDIGLLYYLSKIVDKSRIIFNPYTLICNSGDLKDYYDTFGVVSALSQELTILEIKEILSKCKHTMITIYGHKPLYQSYRKVISIYEDNNNLHINKDNLSLKEDTREDLMPIFENQYGSVVFSSAPNDLTQNISALSDADFLYLDLSLAGEQEKENVLARLTNE